MAAYMRASLLLLLTGRAGGAATRPEQGSLIAGAEAKLEPEPAPAKALGCDMMDEAPPTTKCTGKKKPIIIAGEGKTGTETMGTALAMLGLKTIHYESLLQCCELSLEPPSCKTNAPGVIKPCNGISWSNSVPYVALRKKLTALETIDYDTYDFCVFDDFDVYADVPMPTFTPYIYNAYGNGTKIILTERNATEWAPRRASWDMDNHLNDSAPLAYMFSDTINDAMAADSPGNDVVSYDRSHSATTYSYIAERALIDCTASPDDVLRVDIEVEANDPPKLWAKISKFLGLSTEGIQTQYFPRDTPGQCHAWNVDALFSLHGDAVVQDATNPADFNYFYPVPLPVKKEYACPSSGMNVPTSPFNLVPSPQALPKPPLIKGIGPL